MEPSFLSEQKQVIDEVYGFIKLYSDGSVERSGIFGAHVPACPDFAQGSVATKDVTIDEKTGVWVRIFLPQCVVSSRRKAPVVLHFHPGALSMGSASIAVFHAFCSKMAIQSESIWVSVNYRLAPEHRLPAAYDDAYVSFFWLHTQAVLQNPGTHEDASLLGHDKHMFAHGSSSTFVHGYMEGHHDDGDHHTHVANLDACIHAPPSDKAMNNTGLQIYASSPDPWLHAHADFSEFFLAGESSGGAIVHYLSMRLLRENWSHIQIQGLMMIHAAFLIEGVIDATFDATKERRPGTLRRLCLPNGVDCDHPLVNPLHAQAPNLDDVVIPHCVVAVADQDKLCAPAKHFVDVVRRCGHSIELYVTEGKGHCFYLRDSKCKESELLVQYLVAFIRGHK